MKKVNITEAKLKFLELIENVENGEEVIICKRNKPIAKLSPYYSQNLRRMIGSAKGKIFISKDFDEPLDDFKEYT